MHCTHTSRRHTRSQCILHASARQGSQRISEQGLHGLGQSPALVSGHAQARTRSQAARWRPVAHQPTMWSRSGSTEIRKRVYLCGAPSTPAPVATSKVRASTSPPLARPREFLQMMSSRVPGRWFPGRNAEILLSTCICMRTAGNRARTRVRAHAYHPCMHVAIACRTCVCMPSSVSCCMASGAASPGPICTLAPHPVLHVTCALRERNSICIPQPGSRGQPRLCGTSQLAVLQCLDP